MRRNANMTVSSFLFPGSGAAAALLFFFTAGISAGVFMELFLAAPEKLLLADYLNSRLFAAETSASASSVFLSSAAGNLGFLLLLFLAGASVVGFPAVFLALAGKGLALGFSSALLLQSMKAQGAAVLLLSVFPQHLILLPTFLAAAAAAATVASRAASERSRGIKKSLAQMAGSYCSLFAVLAALTLAGSAVEAFIAPALLQLIK